MNKILSSASKFVFVLMALAVVILTFFGILDAKDFMMLASMAFAFYFSNKGDSTNDFLGK